MVDRAREDIHIGDFVEMECFDDWKKLTNSESQAKYRLLGIAHDYIDSLTWIKKVVGFWPGLVIPDFVGVFLYKIVGVNESIPSFHWIIVGPKWPYPVWENGVDVNKERVKSYCGLPFAYIWAGDECKREPEHENLSPMHAIEGYCGILEDWMGSVGCLEADMTQYFPFDIPENFSAKDYAKCIEPKLERLKNLNLLE